MGPRSAGGNGGQSTSKLAYRGRQSVTLSTLWPQRNVPYFADRILNTMGPSQNDGCFLNENVWILITISLKFVPEGAINNITTLVQVMACRRSGDKPLSEPMMVRLPRHICFTRPIWIKVYIIKQMIASWWNCHWRLFFWVQLIIIQHRFR